MPRPASLRLSCLVWALLLSVAAGASTSGSAVHLIDMQRSRFVVQVWRAGPAAALAHDHVVRATAARGVIVFDPARPEDTAIQITIPTDRLVTDEPELRARYGLPGALPEKDRAVVTENMRGAEQLDVARHREIVFTSSRVDVRRDGPWLLHGTLTIKGRPRPVTMPVEIVLDGDTLKGRGTLRFKTSDFGIPPYAALLGAIRNQDEVALHVDLVAVRS